MKINIKINNKICEFKHNSKKYNYIYKTSDQEIDSTYIESLIIRIIDNDNFEKLILNLDINFYLVIWSDDYLFSTVDHIVSYQLLYNLNDNEIVITDEIKQNNQNTSTLVKKFIHHSGYSIKDKTLDNRYKALLPCQYILYYKKNLKISYFYKTDFLCSNKPAVIEKFDSIISNIFLKLKKKYKNNNIIIPLSAGMDSRFIVSAMKYFDFKNVKIFSYSYQNRRDTITAKKIADYLNYPIELIYLKINNSKKIYRSIEFKKYLNYKNTGNSLNNPGDFLPLYKMLNQKFILKNTDIIINGQAGDFISGNHIPLFLFDKKNESIDYLVNRTLDYIIYKHFNLWSEKKINNDQLIIRNYIKKNYFVNISSWENIVSSYEKFEFENRQVKWVVGQQKVYDYFGLNWSLPLWSTSIMNFFMKETHIDQRKNQSFYKEFLIKKNYGGVWKKIPINPKEKFSIKFRFLRLGLKLFFLFLGKERWKQFEKKYLYYFMDNALITTCYNYTKFIKSKKIVRNTLAFLAQDYLQRK